MFVEVWFRIVLVTTITTTCNIDIKIDIIVGEVGVVKGGKVAGGGDSRRGVRR